MRRSSFSKACVVICSWSVADTEGVAESGFVQRAGSLWRVVFRLISFFDFTSFFPCHPPRIRLVTEMLGRPCGGVNAEWGCD